MLLELAAQLGHLGVDPAPVGLDLGLTGATATDAAAAGADPATGLAGEVATPAAQPLHQVLQLGQLDLRLALLGLRVLGEDVEDQRGAVDDLDLDPVLEVAQLAGRELAVADDGVGAGGLRRSRAAPRPCRGRCRSPGRASGGAGRSASSTSEPAVSASSASSAIEFSASSTVPSVQTPTRTTRSSRSWRYSTSVMSSSSVRRPGDAAQGVPLGELLGADRELLGIGVVVAAVVGVAGLAELIEGGVLEAARRRAGSCRRPRRGWRRGRHGG